MFLTTLSQKLRIARNEANEDTTLLDLTTLGDYANMPTVLGATGIGVIDLIPDKHESITIMEANGIEFSFCGGIAAGKTFGWRILSWRVGGPAQLSAVGTGELGTQAVVTYPHDPDAIATNKFWADNLVVIWYNWPKRIKSSDIGNSNSQASVWFDNCGRRFFKIEVTDADGTGAKASNIAAYFGIW